MKIIICGAGQVGSAVCEALWEKTNIVLIDKDESIVDDLYSHYDIQGIVGSATSMKTLEEAGVETADLFVAVTSSDEANIISSIIAENKGVPYVFSRVRNPEYLEDIHFMKSAIGLTRLINPEMDAVKLIDQILTFPAANSIDEFADGKLQIVSVTVQAGSLIDGKKLDELRSELNLRVIVCAVDRKGKITIPNGSFRVQSGDIVYVTATKENLRHLYNSLGGQRRSANRIFTVGGGQMTYYLLERFSKGLRKKQVKVIEQNYHLCHELALAYPQFEIIHADGTDQRILDEEGMDEYDAVVVLNSNDEENMIVSLYAKAHNMRKVITKIDRPYLLKPFNDLGLDTIITPKKIVADKIIRLVRSLKASQNSSLVNFYQLADGLMEALEFEVLNESEITAANLKTLNFLTGTLVTGIYRQGEHIIPDGNDVIQVGDLVIVVTSQKNITDINQLIVAKVK